jgi:hypothetical protein
MSQPVTDVFVFLFWFDGYIVFIAFAVVVVSGDWSVESFLFPFDDVFELLFRLPNCLSDKSVLICECPCYFVIDISPWEA